MSVNIFLDNAHNLTNNLLENFPDVEYEKIHKEVVQFLSRYSEKICNYTVNKIEEIEEINELLFWEIYPETKFEEILENSNEDEIEDKDEFVQFHKISDFVSLYKGLSHEKRDDYEQIIRTKYEKSLEKVKKSLEALFEEEIAFVIQDKILSYIEDIISDKIYSNIMSRNIIEP